MQHFNIKRFLVLTTLPLGVMASTVLGVQKPAAAGCLTYMGQAVTGASVNVDSCSIEQVSARSTNFTYFLGKTKINAQAHCSEGTWTSFNDGVTHSPLSEATANMMSFVCGDNSAGNSETNTAYVFAPPSNVRVSPNGRILCTVDSATTINTYGTQGEWYYTDFCGSMGVIHRSQLQF